MIGGHNALMGINAAVAAATPPTRSMCFTFFNVGFNFIHDSIKEQS